MMKKNPIDKVKNLLGLIVFGTITLEAFLGLALNTIIEEQKMTVIWIMVAFLMSMVLITVALSLFRPEALRGERYKKESTENELKITQNYKKLENALSEERQKVQSLESSLQETLNKLDEKRIEDLKYKIIDNCSTTNGTDFRDLCRNLGIQKVTSEEALEVRAITGRMKDAGEMHDRYILKN